MQAPQHVHQATKNADNSDNIEPFAPGPVKKACKAKKLHPLDIADTWFLDLCASQYLYNNRKLFSNTKAKSIDFVTVAGQIIQTKEIDTVSIPLAESNMIKLHNVALVPGYNSNLISLDQLRESGITYHDNLTTMTLMKDGKIIVEAKRERNFFMLDLAYPGKAMAIISPQSKASSSKSG